MTDVMLDLETMSTAPTAAIIQIGACEFTGNGAVKPGFEVTIPLQSSLFAGLTIDGATEWWRSQNHEVRGAVEVAKPSMIGMISLSTALRNFSLWLSAAGPKTEDLRLWANGIAFDVAVLENAYRAVDLPVPWHYRAPRDMRTVVRLAQDLGWDRPARDVAHGALADAVGQVGELVAALTYIRGERDRYDTPATVDKAADLGRNVGFREGYDAAIAIIRGNSLGELNPHGCALWLDSHRPTAAR